MPLSGSRHPVSPLALGLRGSTEGSAAMRLLDRMRKKRQWREAQREYAAALEARSESEITLGREAVDATEAKLHEAYLDYVRSLGAVPGEPGSTWD